MWLYLRYSFYVSFQPKVHHAALFCLELSCFHFPLDKPEIVRWWIHQPQRLISMYKYIFRLHAKNRSKCTATNKPYSTRSGIAFYLRLRLRKREGHCLHFTYGNDKRFALDVVKVSLSTSYEFYSRLPEGLGEFGSLVGVAVRLRPL